jgi:hypothetical protein
MAKSTALHEYARIGATARIAELQAEIATIQELFPDLAERPHENLRRSKATSALAKLMDAAPERKRRKLSAAARKAISDAQKKRWAALKAQK